METPQHHFKISSLPPKNLATITPMPSIMQQLWKEVEIMGRSGTKVFVALLFTILGNISQTKILKKILMGLLVEIRIPDLRCGRLCKSEKLLWNNIRR
nr:hypothetical protein CFP56_60971 [Quercus suber]